jgi:hypothetical protein
VAGRPPKSAIISLEPCGKDSPQLTGIHERFDVMAKLDLQILLANPSLCQVGFQGQLHRVIEQQILRPLRWLAAVWQGVIRVAKLFCAIKKLDTHVVLSGGVLLRSHRVAYG